MARVTFLAMKVLDLLVGGPDVLEIDRLAVRPMPSGSLGQVLL
jgi:hypothetical protein